MERRIFSRKGSRPRPGIAGEALVEHDAVPFEPGQRRVFYKNRIFSFDAGDFTALGDAAALGDDDIARRIDDRTAFTARRKVLPVA